MENYECGKYIFFDLLVNIHNKVCLDLNNFNIVRCSEIEIENYDKTIELFFNTSFQNFQNFDFIIESLLNICGLLWLKQPFYDGNTRTLINFMTLIFDIFNYHLNCDFKNYIQIIPIFYNDNEKCGQEKIQYIKKRLIKY